MVFNPPPGIEPLRSHSRYTKLADLNRGSYGFVQLARDNATGEEVRLITMCAALNGRLLNSRTCMQAHAKETFSQLVWSKCSSSHC